MMIHVQMDSARFTGAGVLLGLALLLASSPARADDTYTFTLMSLSDNGANASGTFTLAGISNTSIALFTSINANFYSGGNTYTFNQVILGSNVRIGPPTSIGAVFSGPETSLSISGTPTITNSEIRGSVNTIYSTNTNSFYNGASFFDAVLSSNDSPGGASGGAPTPEVNAALSLVIAGATMAFLRRKRGGGSRAD